jgi:hypothetical protein
MLLRAFWRWHFYAGLCVLPFVITLSLSGTAFLFKPQIERWEERAFRGLPVTTADGNNHNRALDPLGARYLTIAHGTHALANGASTLGGGSDTLDGLVNAHTVRRDGYRAQQGRPQSHRPQLHRHRGREGPRDRRHADAVLERATLGVLQSALPHLSRAASTLRRREV